MKIINSKSLRIHAEEADGPRGASEDTSASPAVAAGRLGRLDAIDVYQVLAHGLEDSNFLKKFSQLSHGAASVACDFAAHVQQTGLEQRRKVACGVALHDAQPGLPKAGPYTAAQQAAAGHFFTELEVLGLRREVQRLWGAGRWDEAVAHFDSTVRYLHVARVSFGFQLGTIAEDLCRFDVAARFFADASRSLQQSPKMRQYAVAGAHTLNGVQGLGQQRIDVARHHLQQALQERPDSPGALSALARAAMHQSDFPEAIALLQRAIAVRGDFHSAHFIMGQAMISAGRPREGLVHLKKSAERFGTIFEHHIVMGEAFQKMHDFKEALQCYEQAAALDNRSVLARMGIVDALYGLQRFERLEEACRLITSDFAEPPAAVLHRTLLRHGQALFEQMRYAEARVKVLGLIILNSFNQAEAFSILGQILHAEGAIDEAKSAYQRAVALNDTLTPAHVGLGQIEFDAGNTDDACDHYEAAIRHGSDTPETHLGYARGLHELESYAAAKTHYQLAIARGLKGADGLAGLALIRSDEGQHTEAAALFRVALQVDASNAVAHAGLGDALCQLGNKEEALVSLERATALDHGYWRAHSALAQLLIGRSEYAKATVSLRQVVAKRPGDAFHWKNLSRTLAKQGLFDEAISALKTALGIRPEMVGGRTDLGDLCFEGGRLLDAAEAYRSSHDGTVSRWQWHRLGDQFKQQGETQLAREMHQRALTGPGVYN